MELFQPAGAKGRRADADGQAALFPWLASPRPGFVAEPAAIVESPTSRGAARRVADTAPRLRDRLLEHFRIVARYGATDEEASLALRIPGNSYRPRRVQLVRLGMIQGTARTRSTKSGGAARVYSITGDQP